MRGVDCPCMRDRRGDKTLRHPDSRCALLTIGRAAAVSVSLLALAGCVSAIAENGATDSRESQQAAASSTAAASDGEADVRDGQVAALGTDETAPLQAEGSQAPSSPDTTALQQGLTMQSTTLRAASSSIYGQSPPTAAVATSNGVDQPTMNATTNSLFGGQQPVIAPQQGASSEAPAAAQNAAAFVPAADDGIPSAVPLPVSAQSALAGETSPSLQTVEVPSADEVLPPEAHAAQAVSSGESEKETERAAKTWTLASLFAPKRREKLRNGGAGNAQTTQKKTITTSNAPEPQVASLAYNALPGVNTNPLFGMENADHFADEDDGPVEVANLSGLARLAPNGLILQTENVETGCFKPALLEMLKTVERHYGERVMVTSGLRPIKVNSERQSLHTRCEAADIQVKGVSKWELADYLRSLPGRGGVGTYCHTESVHIDIGPQRDWDWRCRRRKG
jgi:uncharacterized protein YcbK (DUF882 family)